MDWGGQGILWPALMVQKMCPVTFGLDMIPPVVLEVAWEAERGKGCGNVSSLEPLGLLVLTVDAYVVEPWV